VVSQSVKHEFRLGRVARRTECPTYLVPQVRLKALPYSSAQLPLGGASEPQAAEGHTGIALVELTAKVTLVSLMDLLRDLVLVRTDPVPVEFEPETAENVASPGVSGSRRRDLELLDESSRLLLRVLPVSIVVVLDADSVKY
jgi:hypothetical protein